MLKLYLPFVPTQAFPASVVIVWPLRLAVALTILIVGASLGTVGTEMQTTLDRPQNEPYTFGISHATACLKCP
jgi:ABC-type Fe3+-siderophore transport system permease subunit